MSIIHIKKHECNYAIIDKYCLNDKRISLKATGLHSYLMGLPDNWKINVADLVNRKRDGRESVTTAIKELEKAGYIVKNRNQLPDGRMNGWKYTVYEISATDNGKTDFGKPLTNKD
jgi:predicted transcriptional regulator